MSKVRPMKVDFFHVCILSQDTSMIDALLSLEPRIDAADCAVQRGDDFLRMRALKIKAGVARGDMTRIRMSDFPARASVSGDIRSLELSADEGLGDAAAFLYDASVNTLVLQRNRAVTPQAFCQFIQEQERVNGLTLEPVLTADAIKRMMDLTEISRFEFKVAGLRNNSLICPDDYSENDVYDIMEAFDALQASVTLSVGRSRATLSSRTKAMASRLLRLNKDSEGTVQRLIISGRGEDDQMDAVNLLKSRMVETLKVPVDGNDRSVRYVHRADAVSTAHANRRPELESMLARPNSGSRR